jgi:roadblock/LC7 domain-containing protein
LTYARPGVIASDEYVYRGDRFSYRDALSEEHARMVSIMCRAATMGTKMEGAMLDALGPGSGPASLARLGGTRARSSTLGLLAHKCSANEHRSWLTKAPTTRPRSLFWKVGSRLHEHDRAVAGFYGVDVVCHFRDDGGFVEGYGPIKPRRHVMISKVCA